MTMKLVAVALLGAVALAACDAPTTAQSQSDSQRGERRAAFRAACGADLDTYCPNAEGRKARRACIAENREKFSEGCKTYMAQNPWRGRRDKRDDQNDQSEQPSATP